jgi:hypothetical protein
MVMKEVEKLVENDKRGKEKLQRERRGSKRWKTLNENEEE